MAARRQARSGEHKLTRKQRQEGFPLSRRFKTIPSGGFGYTDDLQAIPGVSPKEQPPGQVKTEPPSKRMCDGCGLNRNAFRDSREFNDHREICEGAS